MKICKSNCIYTLSGIIMIALLIISASCSNLESDQSVEPTDASLKIGAVTSSEEMNKSQRNKCESASQEINDRWDAYIETFNKGDVDKMYSFWTPEFHNATDDADANRDEMRAHMTTSFANGTKLNFTWQLLEQNVFDDDVAYNIGAYHNDAILSGAVYTNNGYYFSRMVRGNNGVWLVDKNVGGNFDNKSVVDPNAKGPIACYKQTGNNVMTNQQITNQSNAYTKTLTSGNTDEVSKFWTEDIHFYGEGLDVDHDGLYQYYRQFFQTSSILASNVSLKYRYVHGNIVYDIGQSEDTVIVNGVQSIKKHNYIIRWEKEHDKVWRISRMMNLHRN